MPFTVTWNGAYEGIPADSEDINLGASRIRTLKQAIREREAVDHSWAGDANDGLHLHAELIPQSPAPTPVNAIDGVLYAATTAGVTELFFKDSAGNTIQMTQNGKSYAVQLVVADRILSIGGDTQFTLHNDGSNPTITFAPNTYIIWDGVNSQIAIVVNGVVEALFPP